MLERIVGKARTRPHQEHFDPHPKRARHSFLYLHHRIGPRPHRTSAKQCISPRQRMPTLPRRLTAKRPLIRRDAIRS
jgi:hypothetical protein